MQWQVNGVNMKVIVAGSRDFTNFEFLETSLKDYSITEVVSGGARGVDTLGEQYANKHKIPIKTFPASWDRYGKAAGHIRNTAMAEYADSLIAFWDGRSPGTLNMIKQAKALGLDIHVIDIYGKN